MMRQAITKIKKYSIKYKQHLFPAFVISVAVIGTGLSIHGWSIGMLHEYFGLPGQEDSGLVLGGPQSIRSDEWAVLTPKSIAQSYVDYDTVNKNIGAGEDAAVMIDAPTKDFSMLVTPWNWGFLFLPIGAALAFKWWFFVAMLSITVYYFCYRFFTKNIIFCISMAAIFLFSPIVQWTFRGFLIVPITTGLLSVMLADVMRKRSVKDNIVPALALSASLFSFVVALYPPFQIVTALSVALFYLFYLISENGWSFKKFLKQHLMVFVGIALAALLSGVFVVMHQEAFSAISNTKHPGVRHFSTGSINDQTELLDFWISGTTRYLHNPATQDQRDYYEVTQNGNESEAAGAIWLVPLFVLLSSVLLYRYWGSRTKRWLLMGVLSFNIFILLWFFVPDIEIPLLNQIHPNRSNLFILFAILFSTGVFVRIKSLRDFIKDRKSLAIVVMGSGLLLLWFTFALLKINELYPLVLSKFDIVIAFGSMALIIGALTLGRPVVAVVALAVLSLYVNIDVNPVYRGVESVMKLDAVTKIQEINEKDPGAWFFDGFVTMESLPLLAGVKTYTTNFSYEQDFWHILDESGDNKIVYNRAAHVMGDVYSETGVELSAVNRIKINLNPCDTKTKELGIKYIVATEVGSEYKYISPCMQYIGSVQTKLLGELRYYKVVES